MQKISIKREQSQAGLSFAEREKFRPQVKNKLLLLLALLMTAATGAMAQSGAPSVKKLTVPDTWTGDMTTFSAADLPSDFAAVGDDVVTTIPAPTATGNAVLIYGFSGGETKYVEYANGVQSATDSRDFPRDQIYGFVNMMGYEGVYYTAAAAAGYTVSLKDGVKDADKWTISPNPAEEGQTVTLQYTGRLKVKGVKATSDAAPAAPSVPDGAINGKFSVSSTKKVYFSKGNLRYASSKWSFFDNQYDYYTSHSADAWDKFGWSTSAPTYGMNTSTDYGDYSGDFVDWGATMGAGWFTLTSDEWTYLLNTRSASTVGGTENGRYAKAKVNDVPGVILFPDTYTHPDGVTAPTGVNATGDTGWNGNSYTAADWTKMESAGCVFLPAAGNRAGSSMLVPGMGGFYWSATHYNTSKAYYMFFSSGKLQPASNGNRNQGLSVRLVQATTDAPSAKPAATVTTAPTGAAIVGVGKSTALVSGGVADGGTLMYAVTTTNTKPTSTAGFSDAVPTAKDITASGTVYVWYYVKADDSHSDSEIAATAIEVPVADIVWDVTNVRSLRVMGTFESYEREGVTLSANAEQIVARWRDKGDPTTSGIQFDAMESGGYTFTAPTGKKFTKIVMTLTGFAGWDIANLGSGWSYSEDGMTGICKVTWKGTAASTVGLLTGANNFGGERVKSIGFYLSE